MAYIKKNNEKLSSKMYRLLDLHRGEVIPYDRLVDFVWGKGYPNDIYTNRKMRVHLRKLRVKLGDKEVIETVVNKGLILK